MVHGACSPELTGRVEIYEDFHLRGFDSLEDTIMSLARR